MGAQGRAQWLRRGARNGCAGARAKLVRRGVHRATCGKARTELWLGTAHGAVAGKGTD